MNPTNLSRLRDEAADEYCEDSKDGKGAARKFAFRCGFNKAVELLQQDAQALAPFDEQAAVSKGTNLAFRPPHNVKLNPEESVEQQVNSFVDGALWQHAQMAERVRVAELEAEERFQYSLELEQDCKTAGERIQELEAAYDALKAELEPLKKKFREVFGPAGFKSVSKLMDERDALTKQVDELKALPIAEQLFKVQRERNSLHHMLEQITKHVLPGEVDSVDALRLMLKERDSYKAAARPYVNEIAIKRKEENQELRTLCESLAAALERIEAEDNGWAGFEAAKALVEYNEFKSNQQPQTKE